MDLRIFLMSEIQGKTLESKKVECTLHKTLSDIRCLELQSEKIK